MKHIFTISLCFLSLSLSAQETITYPYNPDGDVDGAIASPDLLDILGVYGGEFSPSEIQIDGVGLLQVIQDLQNQLASIQLIDVNYVEATLIAHQQELAAHQQEIDNLNQQIAENALPDGTAIGQLLRWNGTAWILKNPVASTFLNNDNIHIAVDLWISDASLSEAIYGHISAWDVSFVTNMSDLFDNSCETCFNEDISSWDVSSVTNMSSMFKSASSFNGDISSWDVSNVTDMSYMFSEALIFNGDISSWDVSRVTDMRYMFSNADSFNGDLPSWDVSSVTDMSYMFSSSDFNGDISTWDVSSVTNMGGMFTSSSFNSDLSSWDVSSVTNMELMFYNASIFSGDLSSWDVSSVTNMFEMFMETSFNCDISSWDVSSVTNMDLMFGGSDYEYNGGNILFYPISSLSEENMCLIHTSFSSNENWGGDYVYDWSEYCD